MLCKVKQRIQFGVLEVFKTSRSAVGRGQLRIPICLLIAFGKARLQFSLVMVSFKIL